MSSWGITIFNIARAGEAFGEIWLAKQEGMSYHRFFLIVVVRSSPVLCFIAALPFPSVIALPRSTFITTGAYSEKPPRRLFDGYLFLLVLPVHIRPHTPPIPQGIGMFPLDDWHSSRVLWSQSVFTPDSARVLGRSKEDPQAPRADWSEFFGIELSGLRTLSLSVVFSRGKNAFRGSCLVLGSLHSSLRFLLP
jgi:hypothetical protein